MCSYINLNLQEFFTVLESKSINPIIIRTFKDIFNKDLKRLNIDVRYLEFNLTIYDNEIEIICYENKYTNSVEIYVLVENINSTDPLFDFETCYGEDWHLQHMYN